MWAEYNFFSVILIGCGWQFFHLPKTDMRGKVCSVGFTCILWSCISQVSCALVRSLRHLVGRCWIHKAGLDEPWVWFSRSLLMFLHVVPKMPVHMISSHMSWPVAALNTLCTATGNDQILLMTGLAFLNKKNAYTLLFGYLIGPRGPANNHGSSSHSCLCFQPFSGWGWAQSINGPIRSSMWLYHVPDLLIMISSTLSLNWSKQAPGGL